MFGQAVAKDIATDILMRGTTSMTRAQLETKLGELKAKIMINGAGQNVSIGFETTRSHLPATLDLLREVLRSPAFPATEFELLQKENLTQLESTRSEPNAVASRAMAKLQNAPYQAGDIRYQDDLETSIKQYKEIKLEAVKAFYQNFFGASNSEISLVGDFDAKEVKAKLATVLGDWKSPKTFKRVERLALVANPVNESFETPDKASAIFIALQTLNMTDSSPDYPALLLANQVFGGGVKSRLMERLRQKEGISYGAGSSFSAPSLDTQGRLIMYAMYAPSNLAKLKTGVSEEVARFIKDGLSQTEFDDAKKALQQERSMSLAQDPVLARMLGGHLFLSRSMATEAALDDKVSKLTLDQVNAAIKRNFKPEMFHHFYAGDFAWCSEKSQCEVIWF